MIEVMRSRVNNWDCDHMGHLNVRHYFGRANEGLSTLWLELGLAPRELQARGLCVRARDQHIRFHRELRPGAGFTMRAGVVAHAPEVLTTYEELNTQTGQVSATIVTQAQLIEEASGAVVPWPAELLARAAQLACDLPPYAAARGVAAHATRARIGREQALARGMLPGFLGSVTRDDCDAHGRMLEVACMGRISDGISHFWQPLQTGPRPAGVGGAALEYRLVFHAWPRLSDVIEVRSALSAISNKVMCLTHYVFDVASGECVASGQAAVVWFDLEARKATELPADVREQLAGRVIADLPL